MHNKPYKLLNNTSKQCFKAEILKGQVYSIHLDTIHQKCSTESRIKVKEVREVKEELLNSLPGTFKEQTWREGAVKDECSGVEKGRKRHYIL